MKKIIKLLCIALLTILFTLAFSSCSTHTHTIVDGEGGREATCTKLGQTAGKICSECGEIIVTPLDIPMLPHTYDDEYDASCNDCGYVRVPECAHTDFETLPSSDASCIESGLTEGKKCNLCGEIFEKQITIPKLSHTLEVISSAISPTCTEPGVTESAICVWCKALVKEATVIAPLGHDESIHESKSPTCTESGWKDYVTCSKCDYSTFESIAALGHTDSDGNFSCDTCGMRTECDGHIDIKNDSVCDVCEADINDGKLQYTVYVKDENGNPVAGVKIQICVGDSCLLARDYMSDENGRFTRRVTNKNRETVRIMVSEAPEKYDYDPTVYVLSFEDGSYEIELTLSEKKTASQTCFTVYVLKQTDPDASPIPLEGVDIEIYNGTELLMTVTTDCNGASQFLLEGEYEALSAKVITVPHDAVIMPQDAYSFPADSTTIAIILSSAFDLPIIPV